MKSRKLNLWEAASIAVGVIIGAGIFSILGVGAELCGRNLPLAFMLSASAAFLVAYSYAKLGSRYVSNAGPIEFVLHGFGDGTVTGTLAFLLWFSYVVSISLFARAFAGYLLALLGAAETTAALVTAEIGVIAFFTALNFKGSKTVGRAESLIVAVKLGVLGLFIAAGIWFVDPARLTPDFSARGLLGSLYAASIFFLTYTGFGLVTNASEDIENPEKNVPRAIYLSLAVVAAFYLLIAVVAVGNLPVEELVKAKDYALAEAAKPFLGQLGFTLIALGALFSTSSAINATLYGGANIAYALAREGELPPVFERKTWFHAPEGLYFTAGLGMLFALGFGLEAIAAVCSAVIIMVYIAVIASHYRLADEVGGDRKLLMASLAVVAAIFALLMYHQYRVDPPSFYTIWSVLAAAYILEKTYRHATGRKFTRREETLAKAAKR